MRWQHGVLLRLFTATLALAVTVHGAMVLIGHPVAAIMLGGCAFLLVDMVVTDATRGLEERR
jgi:hypothetical protein